MEIHNNTNSYVDVEVDNEYYRIESDNSEMIKWNLSSSVIVEENIEADISGEGPLKQPFSQKKEIKAGYEYDMYINADAGAILIINSTTNCTITEVYISLSSSSSWGNNLVWFNYIDPGESENFRVLPDYWDIKVVDSYENSYYEYDDYIGIDEVSDYSLINFNKSVFSKR